MNDRPFETEPFRQALLERRRTLQAQQGSDADAVVELDQTRQSRLFRMDAMQQQAMAEAAERARKRDLVRIEMAERRIATGDYGTCEECGEEIPDGRLAIDPMATRCVKCAD
jgi:DnaK suppressor protein